ncbi:uncharacterized protein K441DRAFT_724764, partial [Cenococcum geophilum 1.58]|uniref:uncharacterized protein n=1 Tax=Cenococcum geophilum 1.58 TaxID=794803 RepID=UPI00358F566B
ALVPFTLILRQLTQLDWFPTEIPKLHTLSSNFPAKTATIYNTSYTSSMGHSFDSGEMDPRKAKSPVPGIFASRTRSPNSRLPLPRVRYEDEFPGTLRTSKPKRTTKKAAASKTATKKTDTKSKVIKAPPKRGPKIALKKKTPAKEATIKKTPPKKATKAGPKTTTKSTSKTATTQNATKSGVTKPPIKNVGRKTADKATRKTLGRKSSNKATRSKGEYQFPDIGVT